MQQYWSDKDVLLAGKQALANKTPSKELLAYLKDYQQDLLTTGTPKGLPSFATQRNMLIALMHQRYADGQGYHQTVGGRTMGLPKFWELVLSMDFVSHEIELVNNIGYDEGEPFSGIRSTVPSPYAEFVIVGEDLKRAVSQGSEPPTTAANIVSESSAPTSKQDFKANIEITDNIIYARLEDDREYRISRELRTDLRPNIFINHMSRHPRTFISRHEIKEITGSSNITELVRRCGFTKQLKKIFFPGTTEQNVYFQPTATLTEAQIKLLAEHKWD